MSPEDLATQARKLLETCAAERRYQAEWEAAHRGVARQLRRDHERNATEPPFDNPTVTVRVDLLEALASHLLGIDAPAGPAPDPDQLEMFTEVSS